MFRHQKNFEGSAKVINAKQGKSWRYILLPLRKENGRALREIKLHCEWYRIVHRVEPPTAAKVHAPPRLHLMMSLGISGILCPRCQTPMSVIDMSAIERKCSKCFLLLEGPLVSTMIEKDAKGSMIYPRVEYFKLEVWGGLGEWVFPSPFCKLINSSPGGTSVWLNASTSDCPFFIFSSGINPALPLNSLSSHGIASTFDWFALTCHKARRYTIFEILVSLRIYCFKKSLNFIALQCTFSRLFRVFWNISRRIFTSYNCLQIPLLKQHGLLQMILYLFLE